MGDNGQEIPDAREQTIVRRTISTDPDGAVADLLELVAGLQGVDIEELPSFYTETDHVVESLFTTPPSRRSQMQLEFSYAGYRITLNQDGTVELVPVNPTQR